MVPVADLSARGSSYDGLELVCILQIQHVCHPIILENIDLCCVAWDTERVVLILEFIMHRDHFEPQRQGRFIVFMSDNIVMP